jgi:hypothetical protein
MSRIIPFRLSTRASRQFLNIYLLKLMKKSAKKEIGVDVGCGEMVNYDLFLTDKYIGTEIDQARLDAGVKRYPDVKPIKMSLYDGHEVEGDFVLCVQVFNNKHFDNSKTELGVKNLCKTVRKGGCLVFNIGEKSIPYEDQVDDILNKNFSKIKKVKYGSKFSSRYTGIVFSLVYGLLMYCLPPFRSLGGYGKVLYCAEDRLDIT